MQIYAERNRQVKCHLGRGALFWISIRLSNDRAPARSARSIRSTRLRPSVPPFVRPSVRAFPYEKGKLVNPRCANSRQQQKQQQQQHLPQQPGGIAISRSPFPLSRRFIQGRNDTLRIRRFWFTAATRPYKESVVRRTPSSFETCGDGNSVNTRAVALRPPIRLQCFSGVCMCMRVRYLNDSEGQLLSKIRESGDDWDATFLLRREKRVLEFWILM